MERRRRTGGRRGKARRYVTPLPKVCYIFIFGEAIFYSAWVIVRYVAMLHPPTLYFHNNPTDSILLYRLTSVAGGFTGLILCCLAEARWGKYAFLYIFTGASIPTAIICWLIIPKILPSSVHGYFSKTLFYTAPLFAASYPLRIAMISLQLPLPQHKKNVRKFYFYHWIASYTFLVLLSVVSFRGYESDSVSFWRGTIVCAVVSLGLISYLLVFILIRKHLVKLFRKKGIVTNELKCLAHGMKYAFKNGWLEYTADKCSVETIENTTQMLNMMMVFTSFLLYYANDQHLENHFTTLNAASSKEGFMKNVLFNEIYYVSTIFFLVIVEKVILPLNRKLKIKTSVLRLIGVGIAFQAVSMILAHALQNSIGAARSPERGIGQLKIYNAIDFESTIETKWDRLSIGPASLYKNNEVPVWDSDRSFLTVHNFLADLFLRTEIEVIEQNSLSYVITPNSFYRLKNKNTEIHRNYENHDIIQPNLYFICLYETENKLYAWCNASFQLTGKNGKMYEYSVLDKLDGSYSPIPPGDYEMNFTIHGDFAFSKEHYNINLGEGGIYSVLIYEDYTNLKIAFNIITQLKPFVLSHWVWPMIISRALGTAMAAVSSYTFTFIQSPPDMRTSLWGLHFFFENFGNVLLVAISLLESKFYRDIFVAIFMGLISLGVHIIASSHFQYVNYYIF